MSLFKAVSRGRSVLIVTFFLIGCARPPDLAGIGGSYNIIGPERQFVVAMRSAELPMHWHSRGTLAPNALSVEEVQRVPSLRIDASPVEYWFARELKASLLATPYLSWSWFALPPKRGAHPVRLVIGFSDVGTSRKSSWWMIGGARIPRADRIVAIEWSETALGRGTVMGPSSHPDHYSLAKYIARGGAEHGSRWWTDNVDLSLLHRQLWPNSPLQRVEIRFIGVWNSGSKHTARMHIANLRLFR